MATQKQDATIEPLYEVLTRKATGHETVHRLRAKDADAAEQVVRDRGTPDDQIVNTQRVL